MEPVVRREFERLSFWNETGQFLGQFDGIYDFSDLHRCASASGSAL
jgi:hypothetical protein